MNRKISDLASRLQYALAIKDKKAADLVHDLQIPKAAISQYLSGKSQRMSSNRLFDICRYLNVSEPWLLGYDVPMEGSAPQPQELTEAEKQLLEIFRQIPEADQEKVLFAVELLCYSSL